MLAVIALTASHAIFALVYKPVGSKFFHALRPLWNDEISGILLIGSFLGMMHHELRQVTCRTSYRYLVDMLQLLLF